MYSSARMKPLHITILLSLLASMSLDCASREKREFSPEEETITERIDPKDGDEARDETSVCGNDLQKCSKMCEIYKTESCAAGCEREYQSCKSARGDKNEKRVV
ncbi:MAG: hypothetical protein ABII79_08555, partial [bacterium]